MNLIKGNRAKFGPLWHNGLRVPHEDLVALSKNIEYGLLKYKQKHFVQLPSHPIVNLIARGLVMSKGLACVISPNGLEPAGITPGITITDRGRVLGVRSSAQEAPPDVARVLLTSGSTGRPKVVAHSLDAIAKQAIALEDRLQLDSSDTMLVPVPLNHAYGASIAELWARFGVGMMIEDVHPLSGTISRLREGLNISSLDTVPSLLDTLVQRSQMSPVLAESLAKVRLLNVGGDMLAPSLRNRVLSILNKEVLDGYGLTEAGPNVAVSSPMHNKPGTAGLPLRGVEVKANSAGELLVKSPGNLLGYMQKTGIISNVNHNGWLATGDQGSLDSDGFLNVTGRYKELIVSNGLKFAPGLLEDSLLPVPGVLRVGVIGSRGEDSVNDTAHVYIYCKSDLRSSSEFVRACRARLPKGLGVVRIHLVEDIPLLSNGKIDRQALRRGL